MRVKPKKAYRYKLKDDLETSVGKAQQILVIEENAIDFARDILAHVDLPSAVELSIGPMSGFEDIKKPFKEVIGTITVHASFQTFSGHIVRMDMYIPVARGEFYRPSIMKIEGKKSVFCDAAIESVIKSYETTRPQVNDPFSTNMTITHNENIERSNVFELDEATAEVQDTYTFEF